MLVTPLEVIDLVNGSTKKNPLQLIDLTKIEQEIIDLDETLSQLSDSICELEIINNNVENNLHLNLSQSYKKKLRQSDYLKHNDSDVQIVGFKNVTNNLGSSFLRQSDNPNKKVCKRKSFSWACRSNDASKKKKSSVHASENGDISVVYESKAIHNKNANKTMRLNNSSLNKSNRVKIQKKGRKRHDFALNELSGDVMKYYNNLDKIVSNNKKHKKKVTPKRDSNKLKRRDICRSSSKREIIKKKKEKKETILRQISDNTSYKKERRERKQHHRKIVLRTTNIFNPNPYDVDPQGLRPVVLDGSNIAIGHGKGKFSVKGLKICVDYFANRGHQIVKLFLPDFRKELFSDDLMAELKSKCDLVFTPSRLINGKRATSYDDRFIVQYAVEFEGVIVSNDNFRDLLKENQLWRHTIQDRLLMFTWVDDLLMFPVDPLGSKGPTLDKFLSF